MIFKKEVLKVIEEHGEKEEVKILVVELLDTLRSECQLLKATIELLVATGNEEDDIRVHMLKEVLERKADYGIEISEAMLKFAK